MTVACMLQRQVWFGLGGILSQPAKNSPESPLQQEDFIRFFNVLSHDLKSPIFTIDGFSDLLTSDYADRIDDEGKDFLLRIRSAVQQMKAVLESMGQMIKLLSRPPAHGRIEMNEVVEDVLLKSNNLIADGGVKVELAKDFPSVRADREQIREALGALLSNALTFTDQPEPNRCVGITWDREDGMVRFCVEDNGMGMDPRFSSQIFELGLKLDKSRGEGPGYGLFLARFVVEAHGGRLTVETKLGEGSRFCFTLPA